MLPCGVDCISSRDIREQNSTQALRCLSFAIPDTRELRVKQLSMSQPMFALIGSVHLSYAVVAIDYFDDLNLDAVIRKCEIVTLIEAVRLG